MFGLFNPIETAMRLIIGRKYLMCLRFILCFITVNMAVMAVNAQIQFGVKAGGNLTELMTSRFLNININGLPVGIRDFPRVDFHAGVLVSVPLFKRFSLQPE